MKFEDMKTWHSGEIITSTDFDTQVNHGTREVNSIYGANFRISSQSIPDATWTTVVWDYPSLIVNTQQFEFMSGPEFSGTTVSFLDGDQGVWLLGATITWDASGTGVRGIRFSENSGGNYRYGSLLQPGSTAFTQAGSAMTLLADGSTAELQVYQNSGGSLNVTGYYELRCLSHI